MLNMQCSSFCAVKVLATKAEAKMLETSAVSSSHGANMKKRVVPGIAMQTMNSARSLEAPLEMKDCY